MKKLLFLLPLLAALSAMAEESISRPAHDVVVPYYIDSLFYESRYVGCEIRVPVTIAGKTDSLILDNGCAQYCVASGTFAREHGIYPIGQEGSAVGVTETVSMWLGMCDSMLVGELILHDITFVVIPDESIDNSILHINAMLGASFFRLAEEMVLDNHAHTITFPHTYTPRKANVKIDKKGVFFLPVQVEGKTLPFQLDLGATRTTLSARYYLHNKRRIQSTWSTKTSHVGGLGDLKQVPAYTTPELAFTACGGTFIQHNTEVDTQRKNHEGIEYGAIGNDFVLSFPKVTLNLHHLYMAVEEYATNR